MKSFCTICACVVISAWSPVERGIRIPFDLESTPLQIKTNSTADSGDKIRVGIGTVDDNYLASLIVHFFKENKVKFKIGSCMQWYKFFPVQPPEEVDKTWRIRKNTTTLSIDCNGMELLNYQFSDSNESECVPKWGGDVVDWIQFSKDKDSASDTYKSPPKGKNIINFCKTITKLSNSY